jgi:photosystem II stability/assembly factor-like uncharacterized protein
MKFWNNKEGIANGRSHSHLSIIVTRDGGNTWNKLPADKLPRTANGEAFAASNTNIVIKGNNTWIVSGGMKARFLFCRWEYEVYDTPIVQGKAMTGILLLIL